MKIFVTGRPDDEVSVDPGKIYTVAVIGCFLTVLTQYVQSSQQHFASYSSLIDSFYSVQWLLVMSISLILMSFLAIVLCRWYRVRNASQAFVLGVCSVAIMQIFMRDVPIFVDVLLR